MTTERSTFRVVILAIAVFVGSYLFFNNDKYLEAEIVIEAHRDCMDKSDLICCNMTPPDFVEYHKARRLLEGER